MEIIEKRLEKKMTYAEAKEYSENHSEWELAKREDLPFSRIVDHEWTLFDEVTSHVQGESGFHELFPNQEYPSIFRVIDDKMFITEGSPCILYRVLLVKKIAK